MTKIGTHNFPVWRQHQKKRCEAFIMCGGQVNGLQPGVPKPGGDRGIYPPNNLTASPNNLTMVYIYIPSNNLTLVCI